jgi:hypothetical protein
LTFRSVMWIAQVVANKALRRTLARNHERG